MSIYAKNNGTWVPVGPAITVSAEGTPGAPTILNPEGGSVIKFTAAPEGAAGPNLAHGASISPADGATVSVDQDNLEVAVLGTTPDTDYVVSVYGVNEAGRGDIAKTDAFQLNYNVATGGTETIVDDYNGTGENWKVHTFTGDDTFTVVTSINAFRWLVTGGGGGSGWTEGTSPCGGGNAASAADDNATLAVGDYAVTIGGGGRAAVYGQNFGNGNHAGGNGGTTVFGSLANRGGGQGGPYNGGNRNGGPKLTSDITGESVTYCNGPRNKDLTRGGGGSAHTGMGPYSGAPGKGGVVIVAYQTGTPTTREIEQAQAEAAARQEGIEQGIQEGYAQAQEDLQEGLASLRTQIAGEAETMLIDGKEQKVTRKGRRK